MSNKTTTVEKTKTSKLAKTPEVTYLNAPKTVKAAIKRILELETVLEDVSRSFEILQYMTGRTDVADFARRDAEELLKSRIQIVEKAISTDRILPTVVVDDEKSRD